jgi:uncharacterized protein (TIGR03437 family)
MWAASLTAYSRSTNSAFSTNSTRLVRILFALFAGTLFCGPALGQRVIATFAGRDWVFPLQAEPAVNAPLSAIREVAVDTKGNLYIPDPANNVVVKVDSNGTSTIFAGNGIYAYTGDGGPATSSSLAYPTSVAVDSAGNVYISDEDNNRIRKVDPTGIINTYAGTGAFQHVADGALAANAPIESPRQLTIGPNNVLYFVENTFYIRAVDSSGILHTVAGAGSYGASPDGKVAVGATLDDVEGIAVDSQGIVYFSEFANNRVRKVNAQGILGTLAGTGVLGSTGDSGPAASATLWGPWGVALDGKGNIFIADSNNKRIRMVNSAGIITTVAGTGTYGFSGDGGPANAANLSFPDGIAADSSGNIWFADGANLRVRRFTVGGNINTVAGNALYRYTANGSSVSQMYLLEPFGMTFDNSGNVVIADTDNNAIRLVQTNGQVTRLAGSSTNGGYSPDGTAATSLLDAPTGVAVAKDGTIYFAEEGTHLIRKITTAGQLVTVAGKFNAFTGGYSGDGGAATSATLARPFGIALDSKGNLYFSEIDNQIIRKVDTKGTISTYAGNTTAGFSGDNGPATSAELNIPDHIIFDSSDNLYIADQLNGRIRKVTPAGVISTVAGAGRSGPPSGDGQLALLANIPRPTGLALDYSGNLYVSEPNYNVVRRIGTDGNITLVAGNGLAGFSGDGGIASSASLNYPVGLAVDSAGNLYITDTYNNRIREVLTAGPSLSVSPATLNLTASAGAATNPSALIALSANLNGAPQIGLGYTVTSSVPWLVITPTAGTIPQNLTVSANAVGLNPGSYSGAITVTAPGATPASFVVNISLTVAAANPPQLVIGSQLITASALQGGTPTTSTISLMNAGGGSISFVATALTPNGQTWLSVTPAAGQITNGSPVSVSVTATPGNLPAGTYSGSIAIVGMAGTTPLAAPRIPVTLSISPSAAVILLSQTGLTFTAIAGGGTPLSQNFGILNTGQGSMNWSATAKSPSGGSVPWLSLLQTSGTVARPYLDVSLVDVAVDPTGLAAGDYYAQIQVTSPAGNSPQSLTVLLTVKPTGTQPATEIQPSGLIFTGQASSPPGSQTVRLATQGATANDFRANPATFDGAPWLVSIPGTGTINPAQGAAVTVQPNFAALNPGVYFGTITFLFGDKTSRVVNVLTVLAPPGATPNARIPAASCSHNQVQFQLTSTQPGSDGGFLAPVGQPIKLQFKIAFTCDATPFTGGAVSVDFQSGGQEPHLVLAHIGGGVWEATWTPVANPAQYPSEPLAVTATWINGTTPQAQQYTSAKANLISGTNVPVIKAGGVVSAASPNTSQAVGVGGLVTIYGSQLTGGSAAAGSVPLPQSLGGTTVALQGKQLPLLYASDGQINVQIPYEVTPNVTQTLVVNRNGALSAAVPLAVASVQPSIFLAGPSQGVIVDSSGVLKDPNSPASAGSVVTIYCTGLGPVTPPVASGEGASGPTSLTNPASVTIGGQNATIQYAGLTPGSPGLYQVNVVVPQGASGSAVPVILTVGTQSSPAATMAIR